MGLRGGGGWAGRSGAPAPGWTCLLLLLLLCAALRSLLASPGSEGERGRAVGGGGWWWCVCVFVGLQLLGFVFGGLAGVSR